MAGRPTLYTRVTDLRQLEKLCQMGATDADLAEFYDVQESTINNWKKEHPEFLESIKKGKTVADAEVANSLYRKAVGYEHPEDKIFQYEGSPVIIPTTKKYAPDSTAAIFWLKNRQPSKWRDKQEHTLEVKDIEVDIPEEE